MPDETRPSCQQCAYYRWIIIPQAYEVEWNLPFSALMVEIGYFENTIFVVACACVDHKLFTLVFSFVYRKVATFRWDNRSPSQPQTVLSIVALVEALAGGKTAQKVQWICISVKYENRDGNICAFLNETGRTHWPIISQGIFVLTICTRGYYSGVPHCSADTISHTSKHQRFRVAASPATVPILKSQITYLFYKLKNSSNPQSSDEG